VDFGLWQNGLTGTGGGVLRPDGASGVSAVPEPASLSLLGLAALPSSVGVENKDNSGLQSLFSGLYFESNGRAKNR